MAIRQCLSGDVWNMDKHKKAALATASIWQMPGRSTSLGLASLANHVGTIGGVRSARTPCKATEVIARLHPFAHLQGDAVASKCDVPFPAAADV